MWRWTVVGLLLACAAAAPALGGSPQDPEVADPSGDVQHLGAPVAAGFEWGDLTSAWFEAADDGSLTLHIQVAGADGPPPQGEVGVTFRVGAQHFIAGYTVVPGLYSGGFLSASEENGDVPSGVDPSTAEATWSGPGIAVTIPTASIDPDGTVGGLSDPNGWSESRATNGRMWRLDETSVGQPFEWSSSVPTDAASSSAEDAEAPGPAILSVLAGVGLAMAAAATRRRPGHP